MIELKNDALVFSFPEVSPAATLSVDFQRTLRIPDDDKSYPLPPGLGRFPLRHVDDFAQAVPLRWLEHGGIMLPMYQSEALWLNLAPQFVFDREHAYPFAIKVAAGKVNAVTGDSWGNELRQRPQDYLVAPEQPWLDGYVVEEGFIRQFVAMPLGAGYSAEEQLTGEAEHGGLQIIVYPMKREAFERRFPKHKAHLYARRRGAPCAMLCDADRDASAGEMALAPGGRMRQQIFDDPYDFSDWDTTRASRCFVHIANSLVWRRITGSNPPTTPPTAREYTRAGLPWFEFYDDHLGAVQGSALLKALKSVATLGREKGEPALPENEPVTPEKIVTLRRHLAKDQVREGVF
jgi:hypothetical protein